MERREAGGAGARGRRQAPESGPPSSSCDSPWEGARESPVAGGDFFGQMDENGIIGLEDASAGEELEEGSEGGADLTWDPGDPDPEDGPPDLEEGPLDEDPLEDQSCGLSELEDSEPLSRSPGLSLYEEDEERVELEDWATEGNEEEDGDGEEGAASWAIRNRQAEKLPERDRQLDMTDEEREGEDTDARGRCEPLFLIATGTRDTRRGGDVVSRGSFHGSDLAGEISAGPFSGVSSPREGEDDGRGQSKEAFPNQDLSPNPCRPRGAAVSPLSRAGALRLSRGQPYSEAGIEGETLPESGFPEGLPESRRSRLGRAPPTARPPSEPEAEELLFLPPAPVGRVEEEEEGAGEGGVEEKQECDPRPLPLPRKPPSPAPCRKKTPSMHLSGHKARAQLPEPSPRYNPDPGVRRSPKAPRASTPKSSTGCRDSDHDRKGQLNYPLPDFSKVGPRVRVPRGEGYRPPKSKGPALGGASRVTAPLLVFKSPADIVREVLMSSGDSPAPRSPPSPPPAPLAPALSARPQRPIDIAVPQEFRSPEQASSLVHQLQEDYNTLLTKYAEAENTIDRLRLEAKVGLYSDPPKPSHSVQSGAIQKSSKVMTLTFPQAQRAQFGADAAGPDPAEQSGTSRGESSSAQTQGPGAGGWLTGDLAALAERFQAQLDSFEDLQKSGKLKPFEQMKGLAGLVQGLDSLERGYLRARDEHRALQQGGREPPPFDPDREVEGQIFRLGMRLEELRERVEQAVQDHRGPVAPPSPPPALDPRSGPTPHPESPVSPVRGGFGGTVGAEVSSVSGESEGEDFGKMEEGLPSGLPPALLRKHHRVETDFNTLMHHYQSFRELPGLLAEETTEADSALLQTASLGHDGIAVGLQRTDSEEGRRTVLSIQPERSHKHPVLAPPPEHAVDHLKGVFSLQEPLPQPLPLPGQQGGVARRGSRKSHSSSLASLGGSAVSEPRSAKLRTRRTTAPSQDGLVSPETDSGFVGSESSHLTPAAGCLPQQGARVSLSAHPGERGEDPRPISGRPASGSAPRRPPMQEHVGGAPFAPKVLRSGRGSVGGRSLPPGSASPSGSPQPWASSLSCGSEPESERGALSLSEGEEGRPVRHTRLANRQPRPRSPSPAVPRHHGDPLRALGSGQLTNRHEAIQSLQAEVTRLKERLEDSLRHPNPPSHIRSPPSASEEAGQPHGIDTNTRSAQCWHSGGGKESESGKKEREKEAQKRRGPPRPSPRKRSASVPQRRPELDVTTDSGDAQSVPKAQSSRRIPEFCAAHGGQRQARPEAVMHRGPYTRKLYRLTPPVGGEENDSVTRNSRKGACPNCHYGKFPSGGTSASVRVLPHSRCPLCRGSGWGGVTEPDGVPALRGNQPMDSALKAGGVFFAVAPPPPVPGSVPVVPCVPVCPSVLYVSSPALKALPSALQPLYLSPDGGAGSAAARSTGGGRRHSRSLSADTRGLSQSLSRAIEAARGVRAASRTVARSLASGLHQQGVLTQSYLR
ncbi:microtubule organization protein AKNA isoform X1 [Anguilla rostrata]|uniref:microtubule organization protein AKNA isoform X1 n=1 Tax=Anguilla rostrata TaxID=7938 RepID=UPI0030D3C04F